MASNSIVEISGRWERWKEIPFPQISSHVEELLQIDTFAAGCISVFVVNRGTLDKKRADVLRTCVNDLDGALGQLTGETLAYFKELLSISRKVLQSVNS